jgi:murein DD-endopeptidase MepM/ murein hydrolase activator NlpD
MWEYLNIYATAPGRVVMAEELVVRGNFTLIDHGWVCSVDTGINGNVC